MKTVRFQTARVHWRMGQPLLPDHFYAQESSLREELLLRLQLSPEPFWGVAALRWDAFGLGKGIVSIGELTLLLPGGGLVDVPGNAAQVSFNLNTTGAARTPLYLHVEGDPEIVTPHAGAGGGDEEGVERMVQRLVLSSTPWSGQAVQSFKLAEFEKSAEGAWALSDAYIPPLVRVTGSPFFERTLERIRAVCATFSQALLEEIQQHYLSGQNLLAAREALKGLYRFRTFLANVGKELHPHPWQVFEALHGLYLEVCVLRGTMPAELERLYAHESLGPLFSELLGQLERLIDQTRAAADYAPFQRQEGMQVCRIPDAARKSPRVYWLLQKPRVTEKLDLSGVKLASETRLPVVHQRALRGIPWRRIESPPFHHGFSSEVEFYAVTEGEEWDHALREGRLAFYDRPDLAGVRAFLYWRAD